MGAKSVPCYNRIHAINDRVITRLQYIKRTDLTMMQPIVHTNICHVLHGLLDADC